MSHELPFDSEQHPLSRRWAVVEHDGEAAWLYLTAPGSPQPIASCFLYNKSDAAEGRVGEGIHYRWSADGESVAVFFGEVVMGYIADGQTRGFSRLLKTPGTLGHPLDQVLYERTFRAT
jgi:hypothetical protein